MTANPSTLAVASAERPATDARPAARLRRGRFLAGVVCGILLVFAARWAINRTSLADSLVGPLIRSDTNGAADAIVVPGAGVVADCVVNVNGLRRMMLASRLWHAGRAPVIVVAGGPPRGLSCPVSEVMARVARDLGVPADRILLETASHNTHENAVLSDPLLKRLGARRLLVVTDRLHMTRAGGAFSRLGYPIERASVPVYEGHPDNVSMLRAGFREYIALAYYRWHGWVAPLDGHPAREQSARPASPVWRPVLWRGDDDPMEQTVVTHPSGPVVILGASYAAGWHPSVPGLTFVNKGVAGQQSFQLLERFERDVVPSAPRAVIVWGFINDVFRAPPASIDASIQRARDTLTSLVAAARRHGIEPVLTTEVPIRGPNTWSETIGSWVGWVMGKEPYQTRINQHVRATNVWLRGLAARERVLLLDFESVVADGAGERRREFAKDDGSHIPDAGYAALSAYASPVLAEHFRGQQ